MTKPINTANKPIVPLLSTMNQIGLCFAKFYKPYMVPIKFRYRQMHEVVELMIVMFNHILYLSR